MRSWPRASCTSWRATARPAAAAPRTCCSNTPGAASTASWPEPRSSCGTCRGQAPATNPADRRSALVEVPQHRLHAPTGLLVAGEVEFVEDRADGLLDRAQREEQPLGDAAVGQSLRHRLEHLELARGEPGDGVLLLWGAQQGAHHGRVDDRSPVGDAV